MQSFYNPGTLSQPCTWEGARHHLSELSGKSKTKVIRIDTLEELRVKKGKKSVLKYPARNITVVDHTGCEHEYHTQKGRFDQRGIEAIHFFVDIPRKLEEFGFEIEAVDNNYKIDEGGGWHSIGILYHCNGIYFHS